MSDSTPKQMAKTESNQPEAAESGPTFIPQIDIIEQPEEIVLAADVPGTTAENIDINVEEGVLKLRARVSPPRHEGFETVHSEYAVGDFVRSFTLGHEIDKSAIRADLKNGVLKVVLPKVKEAQTRKIVVKGE